MFQNYNFEREARMTSTVAFTSTEFGDLAERHGLEQVGGKALSLITMTRAGMPVPPGFVLTVRFFEPWVAALLATPDWAAVQGAGGEGLTASTRALQALCAGLPFSVEQRAELERALYALREGNGDSLYAVRSSSPDEDLDAASFAGGYETTLGVTRETVEAAIRTSFASSFDKRVFLYKREHNLPTDRPHIAVIVQQLVHATSAGVAFSLNPLNNCYDEAVINANHGLGESVVSGAVTPDVFVVDKVTRQILDTQIGGKEVVVTVNDAGGTSRSSRPNHPQAAITPDEVMAIADLLGRVEGYYQKPVDIEWAIAGEDLHLLQARPITTHLPLAEEMLTAPGQPKRLYADATLIEQGLQEPLSVLGTDFLRYILKQMSGPMGGLEPGIDGIAFTAGGRYWMNLSHSIKMLGANASIAPGAFGDASVKAILDTIDLEPYLPKKLPRRLSSAKRKMALTIAPTMLPVLMAYLRPEAFMQKYRGSLPRHLQRFEAISSEHASMHDLANDLTELLRFFFMDYGMPMIFAARFAERRMKRLFQPETPAVRDNLVSLGISLPGNKTAEMGEALCELASSPEVRCYASGEFLAHLEQRDLNAAFLERWNRFVGEFGARCPREIDVATPRPNEQPLLLYEELKNLSLAVAGRDATTSFFDEARSKREAAYDALHELALEKGKRHARAFEKQYRVWVTLAGYRETPKHYVIKVIDRFRKRVLQVGEGFVTARRLDSPEQIFDLTVEDIDRALTDPTLDLRSLAAERPAFINRVRRSHLAPHMIDSRGKMFYPPAKKAEAGSLVGVAISPGIARGRVRVLHSVDEKKLLPGEILVARATDPGWTPLFINAAGIILEVGGPLQHGAIVAREYGIPCVSGLHGATDKLKDGQLVEVDGSNGIVRLLEEADGREQPSSGQRTTP